MKIILLMIYLSGIIASGDSLPTREMTYRIVWKNNNEILVHKKLYVLTFGVDDTISCRNERVFVYDVKSRKKKPLLNGDFSSRSKFIISGNGNRILQYIYSDHKMKLYDGDGRFLSAVSGGSMELNPKSDNFMLYGNYLFFDDWKGDKKIISVFNLLTGQIKQTKHSGLTVPIVNPMNIGVSGEPVFVSQDYKKIYMFDFKTMEPVNIYSLPNESKTFLNKIGDLVFFTQDIKRGKTIDSKLVIHNLKTGNSKFISLPKDLMVCHVSEHFYLLYPDHKFLMKNDTNAKKTMSILLYNHQCRKLKTYKIPYKRYNYPFAVISPDERRIAFWSFDGGIKTMDIPESFLPSPWYQIPIQ
jgi:hypothetical protein